MMGCSASLDGTVITTTQKQPKEYLYKEDVQLVQESWNVLQDHKEQVGLIMFQRLFIEQRQLLALFTKLMSREKSGKLVFDEALIKNHVKVVMDVINTVVKTLDDVHALKIILFNMGERHALYGVEPDMIPLMWPGVLAAVQKVMGHEFTSKVQKAWEHVFHYVGHKIMDGIRDGIKNGSA